MFIQHNPIFRINRNCLISHQRMLTLMDIHRDLILLIRIPMQLMLLLVLIMVANLRPYHNHSTIQFLHLFSSIIILQYLTQAIWSRKHPLRILHRRTLRCLKPLSILLFTMQHTRNRSNPTFPLRILNPMAIPLPLLVQFRQRLRSRTSINLLQLRHRNLSYQPKLRHKSQLKPPCPRNLALPLWPVYLKVNLL